MPHEDSAPWRVSRSRCDACMDRVSVGRITQRPRPAGRHLHGRLKLGTRKDCVRLYALA